MLQPLTNTPVLGVCMPNVSVLRLDQHGGVAPGNKSFKLRGFLDQLKPPRNQTLLSFGGAWSNHLHALAAFGAETGRPTVGVVRGECQTPLSATLEDAQQWGMHLHFVSRSDYRRRGQPAFLAALQDQYPGSLIIPEGGSGPPGVSGCQAIAHHVSQLWPSGGLVMLACATGTTLAGLARGLDNRYQINGICVLKGLSELDTQIEQWVSGSAPGAGSWAVIHDYHCGGYAKVPPALREFIVAFEKAQNIPLDPVYTAKLLFAIHQLLGAGGIAVDQPVLAIHTGGLQGRRGYSWLSQAQ